MKFIILKNASGGEVRIQIAMIKSYYGTGAGCYIDLGSTAYNCLESQEDIDALLEEFNTEFRTPNL